MLEKAFAGKISRQGLHFWRGKCALADLISHTLSMPVLDKYRTGSYYICDRFVMSWGEFSLVKILTEGKLVYYTMSGDEGHILTWLTDVSWVEVGKIHDHISWYNWMICHEKVETYKQCCGSRFIESGSGSSILSESGSGYRSRVLITKNWRKKMQLNFFFFFFLIKNCNLLIPGLYKRTSKLQEKPSALKREHPALQKMTIIFLGHFYPLGSGLQSRNVDPDPHHCLKDSQSHILS